jgi:hypothetical protein
VGIFVCGVERRSKRRIYVISEKVWAIISCPRCTEPVYQYIIKQLTELGPDDIIVASLFNPVNIYVKQPQDGDPMQCPWCSKDLGEEVRKAWRFWNGMVLVKEWD